MTVWSFQSCDAENGTNLTLQLACMLHEKPDWLLLKHWDCYRGMAFVAGRPSRWMRSFIWIALGLGWPSSRCQDDLTPCLGSRDHCWPQRLACVCVCCVCAGRGCTRVGVGAWTVAQIWKWCNPLGYVCVTDCATAWQHHETAIHADLPFFVSLNVPCLRVCIWFWHRWESIHWN